MRTSPRAIQGLRSAGSRGQPAHGRHRGEDSAGSPSPMPQARAGWVPSSYPLGTMLHRTYEGQDCSIARPLAVVGARWPLLILCAASCRIAGVDRALVVVYDDARQDVRAVGSHGMSRELFGSVHVGMAPVA